MHRWNRHTKLGPTFDRNSKSIFRKGLCDVFRFWNIILEKLRGAKCRIFMTRVEQSRQDTQISTAPQAYYLCPYSFHENCILCLVLVPEMSSHIFFVLKRFSYGTSMQTASVVSFQECGTIGLALQTIMRIIISPSFRFWLSLSSVSLVFSLPRVVSASSTASASDSLTATTPWWSASGCDWTSVDENYDWDQRDTGTADEWKSYLGHWSHYNRTLLAAAPPLVPWTEGLMLKSLRRESEDAFALYSICQASAMGGLLSGVMKRRRQDKLFEHGHTFHKTPYRVSDLSAFQKLPPHWPTEAASSRVTTVCPNQATVSCPRWLPDDAEQSEELLHGDYRRVEFAGLWINVQENKKVGLFVEYDGVTGELKRFSTCRQCALPPRLHKKDPKKAKFNLERIKKKLTETGEWRVIQENAASKILSSGTPIPAFLDKHNWSLAFGSRCTNGVG